MHRLALVSAVATAAALAACGSSSAPSRNPDGQRNAMVVTINHADRVIMTPDGAVTLNSRPFLHHVHDSFVDEAGNLVVVLGADGAVMGQGMAMHPHLAENGDMTDETGKLRFAISNLGVVTLFTDGKPVPGSIVVDNMDPNDRRTAALLVLAALERQAVTHDQEKAAAPAEAPGTLQAY